MKKILIPILSFLLPVFTDAQTFIAKGKIEFERKINVHKQFEGEGEWIQEMKSQIPQFKITYFDYFFDGDQSCYKPGRESPDTKSPGFFEVGVAQDNIVYTNFSSQQFTSQKQVFEKQFLIQDSVRKINWKLTDDTRKIAGFNCRKATGIIMDSVFVFAFYTDEILITGGPEGFSGLPGMILGIAIPRINTTWFATKLELVPVAPKDLAPPTKGKKTNVPDLQKSLLSSLKDWGKYAERNVWQVML